MPIIIRAVSLIALAFAGTANAAAPAVPAKLKVTVEGISHNKPIPAKYALCKATDDGKSDKGENFRPALNWSGAPKDTKSFVVTMFDPDVPADFTNAGKDGVTIAPDAKRQVFYHWSLADIPKKFNALPGGDREITIAMPAANDLKGYADVHEYGGPCPPWNDERLHHYHFEVRALDVKSLRLPENATAKQVRDAALKHTLAKGEVVGTYTLYNPHAGQ